ncbi:probable Na(+)/H(+) antiporter nhx-9 [Lepeophtheirus salmonis]|uniref:probable Na(+)/H(+) antiporter nhx-9 n=1 Tax=Lepeophtheirus salmonis TaxID=72036 RepID=UPI001AE7E0C4|nr:probable Na(+)/H(+) antiporter nhx-9 [Lepeophtheirus salmonis]
MSFFKLLIFLVIVNLVDSEGNVTETSQTLADPGFHPHPLADGHGGNHTSTGGQDHQNHHKSVHLVSWRWEEYGVIIIFVIMIILGSLFKILFEQTFFHRLHIPESCLLILTGIILGFIGNYVIPNAFPDFTIDLFFKVLLPPIILDSAYSLYDRDFFSNIGSIILFAIVGTILNAFLIGLILAGTSLAGAFNRNIELVDCLVFSSLISAVDPVAVLAIFEEIGVNLELYFIVFGESLLNDGVTVVLYNTLIILSGPGETEGIQYLMAILSFFTVVLGGFAVGWIVGWITALSLKFRKEATSVEPIIVITFAYLAYIIAETLHWSGILSLIACGICQKRYAFVNISKKSYSTVKYGIKTLSAASDSIIFLFLGQVVAVATKTNSTQLSWDFDVGFILETLLLCLIVRYISVYGLSYLVNKTRVKKISLKEQFIVAYGGLRGAVGFSLAILIPNSNPHRLMFITTTIMVIFFTVFLQGGTIKLLVNKLGIAKHIDQEALISTELNLQMIEHTMAGINSITYQVSQSNIIETLSRFDERYIKRFLVRDMAFHLLRAKFEKIALDEHFARLYGPNVLYKNCDNYVVESESDMSTLMEEDNENDGAEKVTYQELDIKRQPTQDRRAFTEPTTPTALSPENKAADHHNLLKGIRANNFQHYRMFNDEHQTDLHCVAAQLRRQSLTARRISECLEHPSTPLKFVLTDLSLEEDEDEDSSGDKRKASFTGSAEEDAVEIGRNRVRRHSTVAIKEQQRSNKRRYSLAPLTINNPRLRHLSHPSSPYVLPRRRSTLDTEAIKNIFRENNFGNKSPK